MHAKAAPAPVLEPRVQPASGERLARPRLLLDNNVSHWTRRVLENAGFTARHVADIGLASASDEVIFDFAAQQGDVIVTQDNDFAKSHRMAIGRTPGIVVFPHQNIGDGRPFRDSLEHFVTRFPHTPCALMFRVVQYVNLQRMIVFTPPPAAPRGTPKANTAPQWHKSYDGPHF
ncbi:MAG: hypothetical protein GC131_02485 [Alphaproteobacteria bacterium]|nr:hypothetical protein [Alphaproteobacteria bacterium]